MASQQLLKKQFSYLRKLKRLREETLRKLHRKVFKKESKFYIKVPKWMHRSVIERRLFYYFCARNYHYPDNHHITKEFRKNARHVLSQEYVETLDPSTLAQNRLKEVEHFTITKIKSMPIVEVDRYLASLSIYVEADENIRRKVLWEWFNTPDRKDLIKHFNKRGKTVTRVGLNNQFRIRDLILEHPTLCYADFMDAYGEQMPTVTRASFSNARCILRKAGYDIPPLPKGPQRPAVVTGQYGYKVKARMLNDTTNGVENVEAEEPF